MPTRTLPPPPTKNPGYAPGEYEVLTFLIHYYIYTVYTRVQVEFFGRENGLKKSTSTYIRENIRHTYRITKKCQNSLQQAKLRS